MARPFASSADTAAKTETLEVAKGLAACDAAIEQTREFLRVMIAQRRTSFAVLDGPLTRDSVRIWRPRWLGWCCSR